MIAPTPRQKVLLDYLKSYQGLNDGQSPSFREIAAALDISGTGGVHSALERLEGRGLIRRHRNQPRSIEIVVEESPLHAATIDELLGELALRGWSGTV